MENKNNTYLMQSVQKAIVVLRAFTKETPTLSLTELNKKTGISIASLQRFVATLVHEGFLHKDEKTKRYQLGIALAFLGRQVELNSTLITVAKPVLKQLNEEIGESVSLNILDGDERRCILNFDSKHYLSTRAYVGDAAPLYAGASAKSLLAFLPEERLRQYFEEVQLARITDFTVDNKAELTKQLDQIRQDGFAKSNSERVLGVTSISVPVLLATREPIASVTIVIPEVRFHQYDEQHLVRSIKDAAKQIEQQLEI